LCRLLRPTKAGRARYSDPATNEYARELRIFDAATISKMGQPTLIGHSGPMRRMAMLFLFLISLVGTFALWPEERSYEVAERMAAPLALDLVGLSMTPGKLAERLDQDDLIETVAIWDRSGTLIPPVAPSRERYELTTQRLRALESFLAARVSPIWAPAPFAESNAVVRCQRAPDICIVFAAQPLEQLLDFPPLRLTRPLQGPYALAPAIMLALVALGSAFALIWRILHRTSP